MSLFTACVDRNMHCTSNISRGCRWQLRLDGCGHPWFFFIGRSSSATDDTAAVAIAKDKHNVGESSQQEDNTACIACTLDFGINSGQRHFKGSGTQGSRPLYRRRKRFLNSRYLAPRRYMHKFEIVLEAETGLTASSERAGALGADPQKSSQKCACARLRTFECK
jgi:hypothetical protein